MRVDVYANEEHTSESAFGAYYLASQKAAEHTKRAMTARFQYIDGTVFSIGSVLYNSRMAAEYAQTAMNGRETLTKYYALSHKTLSHFEVDQAEYMGEGYWADYPTLEFSTLEEAMDYEQLVNSNPQTDSMMKIRGVFAVYK